MLISIRHPGCGRLEHGRATARRCAAAQEQHPEASNGEPSHWPVSVSLALRRVVVRWLSPCWVMEEDAFAFQHGAFMSCIRPFRLKAQRLGTIRLDLLHLGHPIPCQPHTRTLDCQYCCSMLELMCQFPVCRGAWSWSCMQ